MLNNAREGAVLQKKRLLLLLIQFWSNLMWWCRLKSQVMLKGNYAAKQNVATKLLHCCSMNTWNNFAVVHTVCNHFVSKIHIFHISHNNFSVRMTFKLVLQSTCLGGDLWKHRQKWNPLSKTFFFIPLWLFGSNFFVIFLHKTSIGKK